jgi:predicted phage terminase large subunit-like protein
MQNLNTPAQARKEYIYLRAFYDFQFFVETFFSYFCGYPFSSMHHDFFIAEQNPARRGRREVIAAPRGHAKTTFKVMFKCIHAIVYGYEPFIVIIGHSAPEAESKVRDILEQLETNELLKEVYGSLAPLQGHAGWSTKNFVSQNGTRIMAKSRGKQVRGLKHGTHRPTLIILDDIESPDKVLNENQRYKTQQWLEKDILKLGNVDGKANIMVIGTCLHPEALLPTLLTSPGWQGKKYQAVITFAHNQALWQRWKALYTNLSNPMREQVAQTFLEENHSEMVAGATVLWPEAEPYENLQKMIINEGQASFQSEKQNDPYDPTRQIFDMDRAQYFAIEYLEGGKVPCARWQDGSKRFKLLEDMSRIVMFHDPALGESVDGDYAALVVCASDKDGYIYCLDAYIEKVAPSRQIEQAFAFHKKWKVQILYLEENNFQGILKPSYYKIISETNSDLRIHGISQHHNKEKRIASLEPMITNGQLLFNRDFNPRLISQMKLFPTGHDDGPDALHGAVEQLRKRMGRY